MAITQYSHGPSKVAKSIRKKKGPNSTSSLHQNSRDARKLNRASLRDEKLYRHALIRDKANEKYLERVEFFKIAAETALDASPSSASSSSTTKPSTSEPKTTQPSAEESPFTTRLLSRLITSYISRNTPQLTDIQSTRRPGRSASVQELSLQQLIADENAEFESGFWVPDLRDSFTCFFLAKRWDGSWSALKPLRFVRVARIGKAEAKAKDRGEGDEDEEQLVPEVSVRDTKFPPKGDS